MTAWWQGLDAVTRGFFGAAAFFSVLFVWQMIAAFLGMMGGAADTDADVDTDMDADADIDGMDVDHADGFDSHDAQVEHDADATAVSFTLISVRSVITFFTLFTWGTALYLTNQKTLSSAMGTSALWGLAGMGLIAWAVYGLRKLAATGTRDLRSAVGSSGSVYLDIPENGWGEVRVSVDGVVSYVKARSTDGKPLKTGTPVCVVRSIGQTRLEVEPTSFED